MPQEYDIIVAGAGMAGSIAAAVSAKKGLKVLLIDKNKPEEPGKKTNWGWVCGDAVALSHLNFLKSKMNIDFAYPELDLKVDGVYAISPNFEHKYLFDGEGYILNRPLFEKKLIETAIKNGAEYITEFSVEGPIIEDNFIKGIFGRNKNKELEKINSKITIDALGISTVLRRKLPENPFIDKTIEIDDLESTGRFIYEFDVEKQDLNFYDPKSALIHLNQELAPGGYGWVFPKSNNKVNIGIGVQKKSLEIRNKKLNKNDNLQSLMNNYVKLNPVFKNLRIFNEFNNGIGYWSVSVRRQMESLVFNGYMGAGDSMAMANPISAGGIGPAFIAGAFAGENAVAAIQNNDISIKGLWNYNIDFNNEYGKKTAGLEVFRIYLQSLNNNIINYGMKMFLTLEEAKALTYGNIPELSLAQKFKLILQGSSNINAFSNLLYAVKKMKEFNKIYEKYPDINEFEKWKSTVKKNMEEVRNYFKPNPI
ncbi:MAG: NAD(P)/FAD-dependent oxidoreductase [Candidatus Marsarchaeota archaeon]|nr:NAD(P)/FAD-dependent oxidoreductase [Candidatus Marsarchaeota archaeon]MCL5094377.1 NAD(P)/FAD-dependent oxidoreductase [Candidatus Marsarchaeota archaeon]